MSNAKARHRRRRRARVAEWKEYMSIQRWNAMGGIDGFLRLVYPDPAVIMCWGRA